MCRSEGGNMIDEVTAKTIAVAYINAQYNSMEDELVILDAETIEKDYGWIFFYNSRKHIETEDMAYAVGGNAPILIKKEDGAVCVFGTAYTVEYYIKAYEKTKMCNHW